MWFICTWKVGNSGILTIQKYFNTPRAPPSKTLDLKKKNLVAVYVKQVFPTLSQLLWLFFWKFRGIIAGCWSKTLSTETTFLASTSLKIRHCNMLCNPPYFFSGDKDFFRRSWQNSPRAEETTGTAFGEYRVLWKRSLRKSVYLFECWTLEFAISFQSPVKPSTSEPSRIAICL